MTTPDAIALAKSALEDDKRATKGPWEASGFWREDHGDDVTRPAHRWRIFLRGDNNPSTNSRDVDWRERDARWIAAARTREPLLAAALLEAHRELEEMRAARDEACGVAERRGAAIDYFCRQVDGYDVIKEVADEIEHGVVDMDGRARIPGATVQPNSADRIAALRAIGVKP